MFSLLSKLAFDGIRRNKHLYYPYLLTGSVVIMMFYILLYLANSKTIANMPAATFLAVVLPLGIIVIYIFSLIFLFYTNSLLIKQRYQEFGLYLIRSGVPVLGEQKCHELWVHGIVRAKLATQESRYQVSVDRRLVTWKMYVLQLATPGCQIFP